MFSPARIAACPDGPMRVALSKSLRLVVVLADEVDRSCRFLSQREHKIRLHAVTRREDSPDNPLHLKGPSKVVEFALDSG